MIRNRSLLTAGLILAILWTGVPAAGAADPAATQWPETVQASVDYLLGFGADTTLTRPDPARTAPLLDFVLRQKDTGRRYVAAEHDGTQSAYNEFDIRTDLGRLLQYAYNPQVPAQFLMPSSVRMSRWQKVATDSGRLPRLWQKLPATETPLVVRGVEQIEITPDRTTGTYYRYREHKTLILLRHNNRSVMISISRQPRPSNVGRQGMVLGEDDDWNYFYSGLEGTSAPLVGSLETYIYGSWGVTVLAETDGPAPTVRFASVKWLKAGWKGLNMVRSEHIYAGMQRFAASFKPILESPDLPSIDALAGLVARLEASEDTELRDKVGRYVNRLTALYRERLFSIDRIEELIRTGRYVDHLDRREMTAILSLEYIKGALGKTPILDRRLAAATP